LHAAFYQEQGEEPNVLDEFTLTCVPSALTMIHCREKLSSLRYDSPCLFGVGNPLPLPPEFQPLVFARTEVEEIARFFGSQEESIYETCATKDAVETKLNTATYSHFACHGEFDGLEPLASGLILSGGERLKLADLLARPLLNATRLVVLSACQTAITDFAQLPEEAVGLPSGFLQAGAPGVIGSLWPVNDLSTALLMIKFYKYHLQGDTTTNQKPMSPTQALRHAQLWLQDVSNIELSDLFKEFITGHFLTSK